MTGLNSPDKTEGAEKPQVRIFKNAQEAVDAVQKDHATAIWEDTYMDQINPNYIVFYDQERSQKFEEALTDLKKQPGGSSERMRLYDELNKLAESDIEPSHLHWVYKSQWAITPKELLREESSTRIQEGDTEFYQKEREHFSPEKQEERQLEYEEELEIQNQIRIESGEGDDDDSRHHWYDEDEEDDDRPRGLVVDGDDEEGL